MSMEMDFQDWQSDRPRPTVSLVLPAFNEADVIEQAIGEASCALDRLCDDYEIIVVDDGSSDRTAELVLAAIDCNSQIRIIQHATNQGYGAGLRHGFQAATKDLVAFTDADCQFDLGELESLLRLADSHDVVCGYRINRKDTALRCLYSRVYNWIVRLLLGVNVRDVDCALKLFHREVAQDLQITGDGFLVNSELLTQARLKGHSIVEVGVSHRPRAGGESTVSIHHIPVVFSSLLRYWWNTVQFPGAVTGAVTGAATGTATGAATGTATGAATGAATGTATGTTTRAEEDPRQPIKTQAEGVTNGNVANWNVANWSVANWNVANWNWGPLVVLVLAALFMMTNLNYPLIDRDETRYAEIPREMLATGNWVLPQLNFEPYYDKPPLLYWLCAISYSIFGVQEWAARLVPALAGWLTLAATMWFGTRWFDRRVGLLAGIVLSLTAGFIFCSRYLLIDGVFTALVTLSWLTAFEAIRGTRLSRSWWLASAILCGLAFLAKGPLACVLWAPPIIAYAWLTNTSARPRLVHFIAWFGVVLAVAGPWFVFVAMQDPKFPIEFFLKHNFNRFTGAFHTKPIWYFVPVILIAGHPWSSMTMPLMRFLISRQPEHASQRPPALGFLILSSLWCFVFFSLSKCKLATYLLPIAPAVALIVGVYLRRVLDAPSDWGDRLAAVWSPRLALFITCCIATGFLAYEFAADPSISSLVIAWAVAWTIMFGLLIVSLGKIKTARFAWTSSLLATILFSVMVMHQLLPSYSRVRSLLGEDIALRQQVTNAEQVMTVAHEFSEVPFYLNRSDVVHWNEIESGNLTRSLAQHQESILAIANDRVELATIRKHLPPNATLEVLAERETGKLIRVRVPSAANVPAIARASKLSRH